MKAMPVFSFKMLMTSLGKLGWQLMPVPTAVPPMASSERASMAFWVRAIDFLIWAA